MHELFYLSFFGQGRGYLFLEDEELFLKQAKVI